MRVIILLLCLCLVACSMFRHTTKTEALEVGNVEKLNDSRSLVLKTALRETSTLTYNPDGSILQFQHIQEEVAQSEAVQVVEKEHASIKKEVTIRETKPEKIWIWLGIGFTIVLGVVLLYKVYKRI
jgi:uncharacterized membrane protein YukC